MSDSLRPADIEMHHRLGIPVDLLGLAKVRRVTDLEARELLSSKHPGDLAGIVYPYPNPDSGQLVNCRLRRDRPEIEDGKPKAKYLSAYGDRRHFYFAPGATALLAHTSVLVVKVESEKAVLAITAAAARADRPILAIGTGGCWGWRGVVGKATSADGARVDEKGPLPDFDRVAWKGRDVVILFDANARTNAKVRAARRALAAELTDRGAKVRIGELPVEADVNGPDDLIGKRGDAALFALVDAAVPVQPETVNELLEDAGLLALTAPVNLHALEQGLRELAGRLRGADALRRATARAAAIARLKAAGVEGPVRLVDSALGTPESEAPASAAIVQDTEAWPEPVNGAAVLNEALALVAKYVVLTRHQAVACILWLVHAFAINAGDHSPILAVLSPLKRCGKSTLLSVLSALADRALHAANATTAVLFRIIENHHPTLMLDEADTWLHDDKAELRGIVNSGWSRRGAVVLRCEGDDNETKTFSTWAPKVIAAIGRLPDTIKDRSVVLQLRRKTPAEKTTPLRSRTLDNEALDLRRQLRRWANDHLDLLAASDPAIPDELNDRAADSWRPLLAIADVIGGAWPTQARAASLALSGQPDDDAGDESIAVQLLGDIVALVADTDDEVIETSVFLKFLHELPDRPWADYRHGKPINGHQLARTLAPFDARPRKARVGARTVRGYPVSDLQDALRRYTGSGQGRFRSEQVEQSNEYGPKVPISEVEQDADVPLRKIDLSPMNTGSVPLVPLPNPDHGGHEPAEAKDAALDFREAGVL
ncbi:MAG TPA: DUF3631 domain-containing protein [Gemmatimonadaceae bacterium]|nr:DUF3631 domain-containing protein [Gemmatimonadaceae bacterium]